MNAWVILEIQPTDEISTIKKAYAKKLKIYHPEDDPEGFQLLREAYDSALKSAKNNSFYKMKDEVLQDTNNLSKDDKTQKIVIEENYDNLQNQNNCNTSKGNIIYDLIENISENKYSPPNINITEDFIDCNLSNELLIEEFLGKVHEIYNDFFSRINEEVWKKILNDEVMWKLECKDIINAKMINFLREHPYIPKNIWKLLNDNFHWDEQEEYLYAYYEQTFVKYMFMQMSEERVPRYCYFDKSAKINYEEYVNCRETAFIALLDNDLNKAEHYISLAYEIYPNDPDLLCMKAEYYLRRSKINKAMDIFQDAIRINPDDIDVYFCKAQIMFNNCRFTETIKLCNYIKSHAVNNFEARLLIGKCYFKLGKFYKANRIFLEIFKIDSSNIQTKKCIKEVAKEFEKRFRENHSNFRARYGLIKIDKALNRYNNKKSVKIYFKYFVDLLKFIANIVFYIVGVLMLIAVVLASRGILIIIILLIRNFKKKNRNW